MGKSLWLLSALIGVGSWFGAAYAGPNEGGTLIAALAEGTIYCTDISDYCGTVTTPDCESVVTSVDVGGEPFILNILAALPPEGRMIAITFGWSYDESTEIFCADFGACGDVLIELPTSDWPGSDAGTAIVWATVKTDELVEVYWAAFYAYAVGSLVLQGHPTQGGAFAHDGVTGDEDPIAGFGTFGFGVPGSVVCPVVDGLEGACCFPDGTCEIAPEADCAAAGGIYHGDDTVCGPNSCPDTITGACCLTDGTCQELNDEDCGAQGGVYQGDGTVCEGNCIPVPTEEKSWGEIKSLYR